MGANTVENLEILLFAQIQVLQSMYESRDKTWQINELEETLKAQKDATYNMHSIISTLVSSRLIIPTVKDACIVYSISDFGRYLYQELCETIEKWND